MLYQGVLKRAGRQKQTTDSPNTSLFAADSVGPVRPIWVLLGSHKVVDKSLAKGGGGQRGKERKKERKRDTVPNSINLTQ